MESMTEECQLEFSTAASSVPQYAKMQGTQSRDVVGIGTRVLKCGTGHRPPPIT